ncbi:MAG: FMN-binding protein [Candidatus Omnitrophota bacterium]
MHKRSLFKLILLILLICVPGVYGDEITKSIMPEAESFRKVETPFQYYEAYAKGKLIGYCFNTKDAEPEMRGYSGPMEILVSVDKQYRIINLKILHHNETPEYASGITEPKFLNQFQGKGTDAGFKIGDDIDAVTHATISSSAVCDVLKASLGRIKEVLGAVKTEGPESKGLARLKTLGLEPREARYYKTIDE